MDAQRVAAHAEGEAYTAYRTGLVAPYRPAPAQDGQAGIRAAKLFAAAGLLRLPDEPEPGAPAA